MTTETKEEEPQLIKDLRTLLVLVEDKKATEGNQSHTLRIIGLTTTILATLDDNTPDLHEDALAFLREEAKNHEDLAKTIVGGFCLTLLITLQGGLNQGKKA